MAGIHPRFARAALRNACGLPPCPADARDRAWLRDHRAEFAPSSRPTSAGRVVFDLSRRKPRVPDSRRDPRHRDDDPPALFEDARGRRPTSGSAATTKRGSSTAATRSRRAPEAPSTRSAAPCTSLWTSSWSPARPCTRPWPAGCTPFGTTPRVTTTARPSSSSIRRRARPASTRCTATWPPTASSSLTPGQEVARGQRVGAIGAPPGNGDWPPHVHFQIVTDMLDGDSEFHGVGSASEREVWRAFSPDPSPLLGVDLSRPDFHATTDRDVPPPFDARRAASRRQSLPRVPHASRDRARRGHAPLRPDGPGVSRHGQQRRARRPRSSAGRRRGSAADDGPQHEHALPASLHPRYAERLAAMLPEPLSVCFFVCSGSEANELALRMARAHAGKRGVIVLAGAYHGNTQGLIEVSPYKFEGRGGSGRPEHGRTRVVPMPDDYRGTLSAGRSPRGPRSSPPTSPRPRATATSAAFLCESLLSCGGQIELPPGYLAAAYRHAREAGAVCIADEVQVGFGRVGSISGDSRPRARTSCRHRDSGQAHRQRASARRGRDDSGDRGLVRKRHGVLQHLRREPGLLRDRSRGARRDPRRGPPGAGARGRGPDAVRAPGSRRASRAGGRRAGPRALPGPRARGLESVPRALGAPGGVRRRAHEGPRHPALAPTARTTTSSR